MRVLAWFTAIILLFTASSCKTGCITPAIVAVDFTSNTDSVPDTSAIIARYDKGSSFSNAVNLYYAPADPNSPKSFKVFYLPLVAQDMYNYDWEITLYPSGKQYKITNVTHTNDKGGSSLGGGKDRCINSVSYTVNGKPYQQSGTFTQNNNGGADGYMAIDY